MWWHTDDEKGRMALAIAGSVVAAVVILLLLRTCGTSNTATTAPSPSGSGNPSDTGGPFPTGSVPTGTWSPSPTGPGETTAGPQPTTNTPTTPSQTPTPTSSGWVLVAWSGSGQSSDINSHYANALEVRVTTRGGTPVAGIRMAFSAPAAGPSGSFADDGCSETAAGTVCGVTTDAGGRGTSSSFTANGTPGTFTVTVAAEGVEGHPVFHLTNGVPFTISLGTVSPALSPGRAASQIPITLVNRNPFPITVSDLTIAAHSSTCTPSANLRVVQANLGVPNAPGRIVVLARGTVQLPAQGVSRPTIRLKETGIDQGPACAGRVITLTATGTALP